MEVLMPLLTHGHGPVAPTLSRHLRRLGSIQREDRVFRELFLAHFFGFAPWLWKQVEVFWNRAGTPCSWHGTYNLGVKRTGELEQSSRKKFTAQVSSFLLFFTI